MPDRTREQVTILSSAEEPEIAVSGQHDLQQLLAESTRYDPDYLQLPIALSQNLLDAAIAENRSNLIEPIVQKTDLATATADQLAHFSIRILSFWLNQTNYEQMDQWLNRAIFLNKLPLMPAEDQLQLSIYRADSRAGLGKHFSSLQERIFIQDFLHDSAERQIQSNAIWASLMHLDIAVIQQQTERSASQALKGWLALASIFKRADKTGAERNSDLRQWQKQWPRHFAKSTLPSSITTYQRTSIDSVTRNIGVFLPLSGPLRSGGVAVRDGIAAAFITTHAGEKPVTQNTSLFSLLPRVNNAEPRLLFYDTEGDSIENLYQQAIEDQVQFIIGPLRKEKVSELFTMATDIPILTLNFVPNNLPPPNNVIQFGLAAEDEAAQIALLAKKLGYRQPLVLRADKDWAKRAANAFAQTWFNQTKREPNVQGLSIRDNFSAEIERSLGITDSQHRLTKLENTLGQRLQFSPRRRGDYDTIVLFANANQARAIKPLLAYHYAGNLPVIGSSHVYSGDDPSDNADLNGMIISEIPWLLEPSSRQQLPASYRKNKNMARLFAMGVDAYKLQAQLTLLSADANIQLDANTGKLAVRDNQVFRELPFARIQQGNLVAADFDDTR